MVPLVEIFCLMDDFCKHFQQFADKRSLSTPDKKRKRASTMTLSEVMTILVLFHLSHYRTFKDFYLDCVQSSLRQAFPKLVSYNRFLELMQTAVIPLVVLLNCCKGKQTGTYYIRPLSKLGFY
ncbi:MAG: hypothetical protein ACRC4G_00815 [Alphaproteobacteria bacterium]